MDHAAPQTPHEDCIFCRIIAGEIPADLVHEDEKVIAFRDLAPKAPLHVLVVPRVHLRDLRDLSRDPELLAHVARTAEAVAGGDFRLIVNSGPQAGQTVFHVHAHVLAGGELAEGEM